MTFYFPYGAIAIGMSLYAFYLIRKKRKEVTLTRRNELRDIRREWLDHQLGRKHSPIILYGDFMQRKISTLKEIGKNQKEREIYFINETNQEKWIKEYSS